MIRVELLPASRGDCILIEYGKDENSLHRILIDGGTKGTYKHLKQRILQIPKEQRVFDLLVITHIDADHIAGILELLKKDELNITFKDIWFNGLKHLSKSKPRGVGQGDLLSKYLSKKSLPWNRLFRGKAVRVRGRKFKPIILDGGMEIRVLSPTKKALEKLFPKWQKELKKLQERLKSTPSQAAKPRSSQKIDIEALADTPYEPDNSITNQSSIAFIATYEGKNMLFGADATQEVLLNSIKKYCPKCQALYLDLFKVPHHGSQNNISKELLDRIKCGKYLISTNGTIYNHPDLSAVAKIIKFGGYKSDIYFNYKSKQTKVWAKRSLQKRYNYKAHYPKDGNAIAITFD